jgi:hypothetical protein
MVLYTVAMGVAGEPIAPGNLKGGAVNKNLDRLCDLSQFASGDRCHISPK